MTTRSKLMRPAIVLLTTLTLSACSEGSENPQIAYQPQELKIAALNHGVLFGSPIFMEGDRLDRESLYRQHINVATIPTYWKYTTRKSPAFDFSAVDDSVSFARQYNMEMHGHPLIWAADQHLPDWLLARPAAEAETLMKEHIAALVRRYRGRIRTWDVVNEAIDDNGRYRDNFWNRGMTGEFVAKAFIEARRHDPNAVLLYNDYGMETKPAKFNAIVDMLGWVQALGGDVNGLGWQLHVDADDVLSSRFQLQAQMQRISAMGIANYVTELDVRIRDNSPAQLQRQRMAYQKIAQIFLANPTRGRYFQVWGLSDRYTWWNDFEPQNAPHYPMILGVNHEKKPAYWGLVDAFSALP